MPATQTHPQTVAAQPRVRVDSLLAILVVAALTVLSAALCIHGIAAKSLWTDEGVSVAFAKLDWYNFARILWRRELNMVLYYLLLRGWMHLGDSLAWIRALSLVPAVAAVPAIYALGKRLFGCPVGVIAAFLLAINAYLVRYAQEARSYSLVVLLVIVASYFFVVATESGRRRDWKWYVALSVLAVYAHFYAVLVLVAHGVTLYVTLACGRRDFGDDLERAQEYRRSSDAGAASLRSEYKRALKWIAIFGAPVWVFIATTGAGPIRWIHRPGWRELYDFFDHLTGNGGPALFWLYVACVALAAIAAVNRARTGHQQGWRYLLLFAWLIVPLAIVLVVSVLRPVFLARYMIVCLPALVLLAAVGLNSFRQRWMAAPVLSLMAWFALAGVHSYYLRDFDLEREDFKNVTAYILDRAEPGDAVLFYKGQGRFPYSYYAAHLPARAKPMIVSPGHGDTPQWRDFMGKATPELLRSLPRDYRRVWLVMSQNMDTSGEDQGSRDIKAAVGESLQVADEHDFPCIRVYLYAR